MFSVYWAFWVFWVFWVEAFPVQHPVNPESIVNPPRPTINVSAVGLLPFFSDVFVFVILFLSLFLFFLLLRLLEKTIR